MKQLLASVLVLLFILFSLQSCDEKEVERKTRVLDLTINDTYAYYSDGWIFVIDQDGKLLSSTRWLDGDVFAIDANVAPDQPVDIAVFYRGDIFNGQAEHKLEVFKGIMPGQTWHFGGPYEMPIGSLSASVSNLPDSDDRTVLADMEGLDPTVMANCAPGQDCSMIFNLRKPDVPIFVGITFQNAAPAYAVLDDPAFTESVSLNYETDFHPFDNSISLPVQQNSLTIGKIGGLTDGNVKWQSQRLTGNAGNNLLGYNDGFDQYVTFYFVTNISGDQYTDVKVTDQVTAENFVMPSGSIQVIDSDMKNFSASVNVMREITRWSSTWYTDSEVDGKFHKLTVEVHGEGAPEGVNLDAMLAELSKEHVVAQNSDYTHLTTAIHFYEGDISFQELLAEQFSYDDFAESVRPRVTLLKINP